MNLSRRVLFIDSNCRFTTTNMIREFKFDDAREERIDVNVAKSQKSGRRDAGQSGARNRQN